MHFELSPEQLQALTAWQADKPHSKAVDGAQFEYAFLPTSLGVIVKVRCHVTKTEIDLTDYASW